MGQANIVITAREGTPASVPQASGIAADTFEMGNHPIIFGLQTERYYEWCEDEKRLVIFGSLPKVGSNLVAAFNTGTLYAEGALLYHESDDSFQWYRWLGAVQQERKLFTAWTHGNDSILGCFLSPVMHQEGQIEKLVEILTGEGKRRLRKKSLSKRGEAAMAEDTRCRTNFGHVVERITTTARSMIKTLKLMVLIVWDSLRHPLTESVVDYGEARILERRSTSVQ